MAFNPNNARPVGPDGKAIATPIDTPLGKMTREQAAVCFGISKASLIRRIWLGWPMDKVFGPPIKRVKAERPYRGNRSKYVSPWGHVPLKNVAFEIGVSLTTLNNRLAMWTVEEAFNTPPFGVKGRHFVMPPEEYRRRIDEHTARAAGAKVAVHADMRAVENKRPGKRDKLETLA